MSDFPAWKKQVADVLRSLEAGERDLGALQLIVRYLDNVKTSSEEKFKKIKKSNKFFVAKVLPSEQAVNLLKECGFEDDGEFLVYTKDSTVEEEQKRLELVSTSVHAIIRSVKAVRFMWGPPPFGELKCKVADLPQPPDYVVNAMQSYDTILKKIAFVGLHPIDRCTRERQELRSALDALEKQKWRLRVAVEMIWQGNRDVEKLCGMVDTSSGVLVRKIIEFMNTPGLHDPHRPNLSLSAVFDAYEYMFQLVGWVCAQPEGSEEAEEARQEINQELIPIMEGHGWQEAGDKIRLVMEGGRDVEELASSLPLFEEHIVIKLLEVVSYPDVGMERPPRPDHIKGSKGASRAEIDALPTRKFLCSQLPEDVDPDSDKRKCTVCMCEYEDDDELRTLPCFHYFHTDCIDRWIKVEAQCPICRQPAVQRREDPPIENILDDLTKDIAMHVFSREMDPSVAATDRLSMLVELVESLEARGIQFSVPVKKFVNGERDEAVLAEGTDGLSATLVKRLLFHYNMYREHSGRQAGGQDSGAGGRPRVDIQQPTGETVMAAAQATTPNQGDNDFEMEMQMAIALSLSMQAEGEDAPDGEGEGGN